MIITMAEAYPSNPPPPPPPRLVRPPGALDLGRGAWVRPQDLEWTYTTARGPGGQHVNKASTAAVLRVRVAAIGGLDDAAIERLRTIASAVWVGEGELLYRCDLHRSQLQNKDACEARLKTMVSQAAARPKVRKKTKPTWGSVKRRLEGKKKDSARKQSRRWDGD
jgi:ribosome-associated protein